MFGLLIREGKNRGELKNAGDFVQSIAQRQFLHGKETCLVEIEELSDFKSDKDINVIMNGWFMWDCSKFLPPACINPLFVSFHLTPPQEKNFFTPEVIQYLKKYQPIGTRDVLTAELMRKYGIDSYFSGCLTMTLGKEYLSDRHDGGIYIVDPYIEFGGDKSKPFFVKVYNTIKFCIKNFNKAKLLNPDIVLMDIGLPEIDGIESTKRIKASNPEIKVLMFTSREEENDVLAAFAPFIM